MSRVGVHIGLLSVLLLGSPAAGVIGDPAPVNPCAPVNNGPYRGKGLGVLNVSSDAGGGPCAGIFAETAITCTVKEIAGVTVDIAVEYYSSVGALLSGPLVVGTNAFCAVPAGTTMTFITGVMTAPWAPSGTFIPGIAAPYSFGSARVLATSRKVQCTATLVDHSAVCGFAFPAPLAAKNLTVIRLPGQKGD